jgi:fibronectin-binding autotransporter adhesin
MGIRRASRWKAALYCSAALTMAPFLSGIAQATNYTGGAGAQGTNGSFPNTGCVCNSGQAGGPGGANGFGGGNASAGAASVGYESFNLGGGGGGADGGGGGGGYYASGAGGGGGGAGGAGYLLGSGSLSNSGSITGGAGGDGGYSIPYYGNPSYSIAGGGGGGGGGSGIIVTGTATLTNTGNIVGGGGGTGAFANDAASGLDAYTHLSDNGGGGYGGYGIRADGAVGLTVTNSGNITGGEAGYNAVAGQSPSGAAIYGQNITLTTTAGTIEGGDGQSAGSAIYLTGGSNTLNIQGGTLTNHYGTAIVAQSGTNIFNISGGSVTNNYVGYGLQVNGGTNTLNVTGGTLSAVYLAGGATTLEGTSYSNALTLAHGATAEVMVAGGDVSGITNFDNHGGLTVDTGRFLTLGAFTNESDGTLNLGAGAQLISSNLNLIAGSAITGAGLLSSGSSAFAFSSGSVSAALGGTGGLDKTGAGTLTLTGANSYTGGTTIGGGTLAIAIGALGGGDVHMAQGTAIAFTGSSFITSNNFYISGDPIFNVASGTTQTVSGVIADDTSGFPVVPGVVEKTGAGELVLSGANTYSGGTTVSAGTLTLGANNVSDGMGGIASSAIGTGTLTLDGGTLSSNAAGRTVANAILVTSNGGVITPGTNYLEVDGNITDSGAPGTLTIGSGAGGTVFLAGTNSYSAGTTVNLSATLEPFNTGALSANSNYTINGTLAVRDLGSAVTIKSLVGTGTVSNILAGNGILAIATAFGQTATFDGTITDFGGGNPHIGILINGQGTEIFAGSGSNYSGGTTLTSGILGVGANNALGNGTVIFDGGTLQAEGGYTLGNALVVNGTGGTIDANGHNLSLGGLIDGTGVMSGTSLVISSSTPGTVTLSDDSSYTGTIQVNSGAALKQGGGNIMPGGAYLVNGGLQVSDATIASLNGSGIVQDSGGGGTLDISIASGSASFSGTLRDSTMGVDVLSIVKDGAGTQILSGNNTYTGGTTLNAGTLIAGSNTALGDSSSVVTITGGRLGYANGVNIANNITLSGAAILNVAGTDVATQTGVISDDVHGPHSLEKTGTGTLKLAVADSYAGPTTISAGTLEIGDGGALGAGTVNFDGGTLKVDGAYNIGNDFLVEHGGGVFDTGAFDTTLSGTLSDDGTGGTLSVAGSGTVTITGINNLTGGTAVATGGTLVVANAFALSSGTVALAHGSTIDFTTITSSFANQFTLDGDPVFNIASGITTTLTGIIADAGVTPGVLEKQGAGALVLTAANTYTGGTMLSAGILRAGNSRALGSGVLTLDGGILASDSDIALANAVHVTAHGGTVRVDGNTIELDGVISDDTGGGGVLHLSHDTFPGAVILTAANTYTQGTTIDSGVTAVAGTATSFGTGTITVDGGVLTPEASTALTITNAIAITNNGATILGNGTTLTLSGIISDAAGDTGALTIGAGGSTDTSIVILSGTNSYSGGTTIAGGTVKVSGSSALGNAAGGVEMKSGTTLDFASSASLANALILDDATPTLNVTSGSATLGGGILELTGVAGGFSKTGGGTLKLTGASGNSGATIISAGTLEVGDGAASSSSAYQVASGATLAFDSQTINYALIGSLAGAGTVTSNTLLEVGGAGTNSDSTTFSGVINSGSGLTYNGAGTLTLTGTGSTVNDLVICSCVINGGVTLSGGSLTAANSVGVESGTLTVTNGVQLTTPEFDQSGGTVTISGAGTVVTATSGGAGLIGVFTNGSVAPSFTVSGGAQITSDNLLTGIISGTNAPQITVTGTGTVMGLTSGVQLDNGTVLTVADDASLTTPSITLDHNATLAIGNGGAAGTIGDANTQIQGLSSGTSLLADFTGDATLDGLLTGALAANVQAGNLTITNVLNDFTGGITIAHGATLTEVNNSMGTGAIANNGTLVLNNSSAVTFANTLTGSGDLNQAGNGAVTLNTAQVYTGRTVITGNATLFLAGMGDLSHSSEIQADGTFDVSSVTAPGVSITSLSGSGDVEIGSKVLTITNGSGVFSGILSDGGAGGSLMLEGGDEVLNGVISLTGGTTIAAGTTVVVSGPNALGSGPLDLKAGAILKFGASGTYTNGMTFENHAPIFDVTGSTVTLSGALSGAGDLGVTGAGGTLILTNTANSYAGGTEVYGGSTLRVNADSELGATATILQLGDATTKGTLQFADTFNLSAARTITLMAGGGSVNTNGFNTTISQAIGGTGGLTKTGAGTLTLAGASSYAGATTVNGGTLSVTGSVASAMTAASGGTLGGTGTVGATTVASGGTIAPGVGGAGTLHVTGPLTLAGGSTTAVAVTPAAATQIAVTGAASLGGTLALSPAAGTYANGTDYKLISASSVNGTFSSITGAAGLNIASTVQYSATGVDLILGIPGAAGASSSSSGGPATTSGSPGTTSGVTTTFLFGSYGSTPNQVAAGNALAAGVPSGALYTSLGKLVSSSTASVPAVLGQLAGEIHASMRGAMIQDSHIIRDMVLARGDQGGDGVSMWASSFGDYGSLDGIATVSAIHHNDAGIIVGADMEVKEGLRAGIAAAYTVQKMNAAGVLSSATGTTNHIAGYLNWNSGQILVNAGGDYGWGVSQVRRQVTALAENDTDHQTNQVSQGFGNVGYRLTGSGGWMTEPYAGIAYVSANTGAFAETGGVGVLSGASRSDTETYSTLGMRAMLGEFALGGDISVTPRADFAWQHAFNTLTPGQALTFIGASQSFTVMGVPLDTDAAAIQVGLDAKLMPGLTLSVGYDGNIGARDQDHAIRGSLSFQF